MSGDRELCNVHPGSGDGNADCDWPNINPNSDSRRKRLLRMRGQYLRSAEQWRLLCRLRAGAASGVSGYRRLRNLYPYPSRDWNCDRRRERLLPMPGQHMCSAEQRRVFRRLRPRAASGVFGRWRLRDVYADADRDSHSNRRSERLLPV